MNNSPSRLTRRRFTLGSAAIAAATMIGTCGAQAAAVPPVEIVTTFAAGVCAAAREPVRARELLAFLASPDADAAKRRHGMEPARP